MLTLTLVKPSSVLTKPEHIRAVFKDSDKHLKATNSNSGYLMSQVLGQCVGLVSQHDWHSLRAAVGKPFVQSAAVSYVSLIERRTARFLSELDHAPNLARGLVDPASDFKMLPFWIVAEVIYGDVSAEMEAALLKLVPLREDLFRHVIHGGIARYGWSRYLPTEANRVLKAFQTQWTAFNEMAYLRAVERGSRAPIVDMFGAVHQGIVSLPQLLQTLDEMLYANLDVTLGGISWNLVFLAADKGVQDHLRDELSEVRMTAQRTRQRNGSQPLTSLYLGSSSLLAACVNESSRLRPLAAFSVPQAAPTDRIIGDYLFPAGTNFVIDSYALNVRDPVWGPDRAKYRPERFLERNAADLRYGYWRFGFGPRQCMGKHLADMMIRVLIVQLLEKYELELVEEETPWLRDTEMWINHPKMVLKCVKREA